MKVLLLTSINPVLAGDAYSKIANALWEEFPNKDVDILCYPFFAEIERRNSNKEYIPLLFAMMEATRKPDVRQKLFANKRVLVIGNSYKDEKFDMIISLNDLEDKIFDSYIEMIKTEEDLKEFAERVEIDNLFSPEDAEFNLPTIDHAILFIKEIFYGNRKDSKTKQ